MKAIILVAGYATRLYPLTIDQPKALLPLGGKPMLNYIMEKLEKLSVVDEVLFVSNAKFYQSFVDWAKTLDTRLKLEVINDGTDSDETKLGAIGDMNLVIKSKNIDDDIIVLAGDNYFTFELTDFYDFYKECCKDCICAKVIDNKNELKRMAVAQIDENGKITHLEEKPQEPKSDIGVFATYIYTKDTIKKIDEYLAEGNSPDAPGNLPAWLYKKQDVYLYLFDGECYDVGTPESYEMVNNLLKK